MTQRYDVVVYTQSKDGKEYPRKVGAAFPQKNGEGFNIVLDFPVGVTRFAVFPAKPKKQPDPQAPLDDDIGF